jgi:hypothetical protein
MSLKDAMLKKQDRMKSTVNIFFEHGIMDLTQPKSVEAFVKSVVAKESARIEQQTDDAMQVIHARLSEIVFEKGEKGEPGEKGEVGPQGEKGEKGEKGERGADGKDGARGERGPAGLRGEQGPRGKDSTVPGPKGEKGARGPKGEAGSKGKGLGRIGANTPQFVAEEIVAGSGTTWQLMHTPDLGNVQLFVLGVRIFVSTGDYTISGDTITTTLPFNAGELIADYHWTL